MIRDDGGNVRPGAGERSAEFAAAMKRAEGEPPASAPHPLDPIARTRGGMVVRRNGDRFYPGALFDMSSVPLLDG